MSPWALLFFRVGGDPFISHRTRPVFRGKVSGWETVWLVRIPRPIPFQARMRVFHPPQTRILPGAHSASIEPCQSMPRWAHPAVFQNPNRQASRARVSSTTGCAGLTVWFARRVPVIHHDARCASSGYRSVGCQWLWHEPRVDAGKWLSFSSFLVHALKKGIQKFIEVGWLAALAKHSLKHLCRQAKQRHGKPSRKAAHQGYG